MKIYSLFLIAITISKTTKLMFEFERFIVYQRAIEFYSLARKIDFGGGETDRLIARQLFRASLSISLNIAEGIGRLTPKDKRNFLIIARGSLYESIALINVLNTNEKIKKELFTAMYTNGTEISKMLHALISQLDEQIVSSNKK